MSEKISKLSKKKDKTLFERMQVCDHCAWKYGGDECVRDGDCDSPILTGFKPDWIWKLIETPVMTTMTDNDGNKKEFKYSKFTIEKR